MAKLHGAAVYLLTQWKYSPTALYASAFCMAAIMSMLMVALPWRIIALGGNALAVGASGGLLMGVYVFSCILIRPHLDRLGVKRLVMASCFLTAGNCALLTVAPTVSAVLCVVCLQAIVTGAFWSPLIGWLSGVHEGKALNHRLGRFSFFWATGSIVGSSLGGPLLNLYQWLPFLLGGVLALFVFVLAAMVHQKKALETHEENAKVDPPKHLVTFRWMTRVGLVVSFVGLGLLRTPLASLLKEMLPTEQEGSDMHSIIMGLSSGMLMVCFYVLGKTQRWHFRLGLLLGMQLVGVALLACIGWVPSVWGVGLCAVLTMTATSFIYSSHVFYTLSGGAGRAAGMALHEIVLAIGFAFGSFGGGVVGQWIGIRWAYYMGAAVWLTGIAVQIAIYLRKKASTS